MMKFLRSFTAFVVTTTFFTGTVFAQTGADVVSTLPSNTTLLTKVDASHFGSFLSEQYSEYIVDEIVDEMLDEIFSLGYFSEYDRGSTEYTEAYIEMSEFFKEFFLKTPVYFGIMSKFSYEDPSVVVAFEINQHDYIQYVSPILHGIYDVIEDEDDYGYFVSMNYHEGDDYYTNDDYERSKSYVLYRDGILYITTNGLALNWVKDLGVTGSNVALTKSSDYYKVADYLLSDSALDFYINLKDFYGFTAVSDRDLEDIGISRELFNVFADSAYSFSIGDLTDSIEVVLSGSFYNNLVKEFGFEFSDAEVELFKHLDVDEMLYVYDVLDAGAIFDVLIGNIADSSEFGIVTEEFGSVFSDIADGLGDELMIAVYNTDEILPAITVMSELGDNSGKIKSELSDGVDEMVEMLKDTADKNEGNTRFSFRDESGMLTVEVMKTEVAGSRLHKIEFSYVMSDGAFDNASFESVIDTLSGSVTFGVLGDRLVLSTDGKLNDHYSKSIVKSSVSKFVDRDSVMFEYVDFKNVEKAVLNFIDKVEKPSDDAFVNNERVIDSIETVFAPLNNAYGNVTVNGGVVSTHSKVDIDYMSMLSTYETAFRGLEASAEMFELAMQPAISFTDVADDSLYHDDVYYLASHGVINGYDDGTFDAEGDINRVEFTKLMVEILDDMGYVEMSYDLDGRFNDVSGDNWYNEYLATAVDYGLIHGYEDGNFYPGNTISRAEVAQILKNIVDTFDIELNLEVVDFTYSDIEPNAWYVDAVNFVIGHGIMNSVSGTEFGVNQLMTRGESAMAIRNMYDILDWNR